MANTIQVKRGAFASLPTLAAGEFGFCTDTKQPFIGDGTTNYEIALKSYVDNMVTTGLDVLPAVLDKDLLDPPGSPVNGARYWLGGTALNDWAGKDYQIAEWVTDHWVYTVCSEGHFAYVDDENTYYYYTGAGLAVLSTAMGAHSATHTNGTDDIQSATNAQKGLATAAHIQAIEANSSKVSNVSTSLSVGTVTSGTVAITSDGAIDDVTLPASNTSEAGLMTAAQFNKLAGITAGADVTNATTVNAAGAVMEADFNAQTILAALTDDTPTAITITEQSVLGRLTGGDVGPLTGANLWTVLSGTATGNVGMNSQRLVDLLDPISDQDAATMKWVSDNFSNGSSTFLALTDTPTDFTDDGLKVLRVNTAADGVEFVSFASTYLEGTPTENEAGKAPTSEWAFDHAAASTGVHGASTNTLLHSGSVIDGGTFT